MGKLFSEKNKCQTKDIKPLWEVRRLKAVGFTSKLVQGEDSTRRVTKAQKKLNK